MFLTLTLRYFFWKGRIKGCYLPLKYDTDGAAILAFHLTNKKKCESEKNDKQNVRQHLNIFCIQKRHFF